ncbi:MAG: pilus assembly protein, partial [Betaproteobacteria bacterium]|nr:pilus assembly protein [Betaproteobacteria bacterium]
MDRFTSLAVVRRRHAGTQAMRGGAMVEFALVLPLLLLIVFGVVGFSVALLDKVVMTNATREAARQGTTFRGVNLRPSLADVQKVATDFCTANLIDFGTRSG